MSQTQRGHRHLLVGSEAATATDLYQLTMMYAYFTAGMAETEATFEYFSRKLPRQRRYMVFAGLEQALAYLRDLEFTGEQLDYLRSLDTFAQVGDPASRDRFFQWLRAFSFEDEVWAAPEGTVFFPNEPMLQVRGNLLRCQLIETFLLSVLNYQTLVATKAARIREAAGDRSLLEFGTRRGHSPMAGLMAARAACVGGFDGTSNVLAGQLLGIPVKGTAAHAYTMSFDSELEAFSHYLATYPESTTLLIDTYDTVRGAQRAASLGAGVKGVRLDSGDLGALARQVRAVLDEHGLEGATIVASNDLNEYKIRDLVDSGAPIDAFGVGTELVTSRDDPTLSGVYKLVERVDGGQRVPTMKFSSSKPSYPGRKALLRAYDAQGQILAGVLVQSGEAPPEVPGAARLAPLLEPVFEGSPLGPPPSLEAIQAHMRAQVAALPASRRSLDAEGLPGQEIPLIISAGTQAQMEICQERFQVERH